MTRGSQRTDDPGGVADDDVGGQVPGHHRTGPDDGVRRVAVIELAGEHERAQVLGDEREQLCPFRQGCLRAMRPMNLAISTTKRSWVPSPTRSCSSSASTRNTSRRPSRPARVARKTTRMPIGVAAR